MNTLRSRPQVGSISHGVLVTEDLIQVFTYELTLYKGEGDPLVSEANIWLAELVKSFLRGEEGHVADLNNPLWLSHEAHGEELIIELMTALNELAPPYCYFGTHEGDGADFGFWPDWDEIDRLKFKDDEDRDPHEDYKEVNDHGNLTVYSADGTILL